MDNMLDVPDDNVCVDNPLPKEGSHENLLSRYVEGG